MMEGVSQLLEFADGDRVAGFGDFEPSDPGAVSDADEVPPALARAGAFAGKRPFYPGSDDESDDPDAPSRPAPVPLDGTAFVVDRFVGPDLDGYFDCFALPVRDRVLLCRSYASYLVAKGQSGIRRPGPKAGFKAPRRV